MHLVPSRGPPMSWWWYPGSSNGPWGSDSEINCTLPQPFPAPWSAWDPWHPLPTRWPSLGSPHLFMWPCHACSVLAEVLWWCFNQRETETLSVSTIFYNAFLAISFIFPCEIALWGSFCTVRFPSFWSLLSQVHKLHLYLKLWISVSSMRALFSLISVIYIQ